MIPNLTGATAVLTRNFDLMTMPMTHARNRKPGFTLVELLMAIGIMVLLAGILTIGFKKMGAAAKGKVTSQMLGNCQALLVEFEKLTRLKNVPKDPIPAPGKVEEGAADRNGTAVKATRELMTSLRSIPVNKAALDQLPPAHVWPGKDREGPVVLDGWGNPIVFVPAGGLTGVKVKGVAGPVKSLDERPFFASAGPDGSFAEGEDNLYSFQTR